MILFLFSILTNLQILKNSENEISFVFKPDVKVETLSNCLFFKGERFKEFDPGLPDLPSYLIPIEIEPNAEYEINYKILKKRKITKFYDIKRIPEIREDGLSFYEIKKEYKTPFPGKIIIPKGTSFLRFKNVLYLILFPVQIKENEIEIINKILINVKVKNKNLKNYRIFPERKTNTGLYERLLIKRTNLEYKKKETYTSFWDKTRLWLKIFVFKNGVYYITYDDIKENLDISPENLDISKICLYARLKALPVSPDSFDVKPEKVPFVFIDNGEKGIFDERDTILFVGFKAEGYRIENGKISFYFHPYTENSVYFLSFEGDSGIFVQSIDGTPGNYKYETKGTKVTRHEKNFYNLAKAGLKWVGEQILDTVFRLNNLNFFNPLPDTARINFVFIRRKKPENNTSLNLKILLSNKIIFERTYPATSKPVEEILKIKEKLNSSPSFSLDVNGMINLDYFEVKYNSLLFDIKDSLIFYVYVNEKKNFLLRGEFAKRGKLFKVKNPFEYYEIKGFYFNSDSIVFSLEPEQDTFMVVYAEKYIHPYIQKFNRKFLNEIKGADYLIIGPESFRNLFRRYIYWRENNFYIDTVKINDPEIIYINIEDIFEEFGFGVRDPVALRNFLKFAYLNFDPVPYYVLLAGKGIYDFRNFLKSGVKNYIPPYEYGYEVDINHPPFTYDDFFVEFDGGVFDPDMVIGRIPGKNAAEMLSFLNRIINYEKGIEKNDFKNKVLGIADDTTGSGGSFDATGHTNQVTEILKKLPNTVDKQGFYMLDYPREAGKKPAATKALLSLLENGFIFVFYFGHGNPNQLAHEEILTPDDIDLMEVNNRPHFILLGSCKTMNFDRPEGAIGEKWIMKAGSGGLGSAALTQAFENQSVIQKFFKCFKDFKIHSVGECAYFARFGSKKYLYLGDPTVLYKFPENTGIFSYKPDTLSYSYFKYFGDTLRFFRTIDSFLIKFKENSDVSFLNIETEPYIDTLVFKHGGITYRYYLYRKGKTLFRGAGYNNANVSKFKFILPKKNSDYLRVISYNTTRFGELAFIDSFPVKLSDNQIVDYKAPEIKLSVNGKPFKNNDTLPPDFNLYIEIFDENGINIAKDSSILLSIDGKEIISLNEKFYYKPGSFQKGYINYKLKNLSSGKHNLSLSAYDPFDNRGKILRQFYVTAFAESLFVRKVIPYPNPASSFFFLGFEISKKALCKLKIYTMRGIPVFESPYQMFSAGFNSLKWRIKRDIANGLYIYLLEVKDPANGKKIKKRGKLIVYR